MILNTFRENLRACITISDLLQSSFATHYISHHESVLHGSYMSYWIFRPPIGQVVPTCHGSRRWGRNTPWGPQRRLAMHCPKLRGRPGWTMEPPPSDRGGLFGRSSDRCLAAPEDTKSRTFKHDTQTTSWRMAYSANLFKSALHEEVHVVCVVICWYLLWGTCIKARAVKHALQHVCLGTSKMGIS